MSRFLSFQPVVKRTASFLFLSLLLLFLAGCVAQEKAIKLDTGDVPDGKGVVFVVVGNNEPSMIPLPSFWIGREIEIRLNPAAVNRLYLDEGWYTLTIGTPGSLSSGDVSYRVEAGSVTRFAVIQRQVGTDDDTINVAETERELHVIPVTREGMHELLRQHSLPIETIYH